MRIAAQSGRVICGIVMLGIVMFMSITHLDISIRQPIIPAPFCPLLCAEIILNLALLGFGAFRKWMGLAVFPAPAGDCLYVPKYC